MFRRCFQDNYIEINGDPETYTTSSSGLSINGLPGLNMRLFSNAADGEQATGLNLAKQSLQEAINRVCSDFLAAISDEFLFSNVITNGIAGNVAKHPLSNTLGTKIVGRKFTKVDCDNFTEMYFGRFSIYSEQVQAVDFYIADGNTVTTKTFNLVVGLNTFELDYTANSDAVVISYDQTGIYTPDELLCNGCGTCNDANYYCLGCSWHTCSGYTTQEVENTCDLCNGLTALPEHYSTTNEKSGLSVEVQIRCSDDALLCAFKNDLKFAIRYAMAIDICENALLNGRMNPVIRNSKDEIKEMLSLWDGRRNEVTGFADVGKYQSEIKLVAERANKMLSKSNRKTRCISCNSNRIGFSVP